MFPGFVFVQETILGNDVKFIFLSFLYSISSLFHVKHLWLMCV